jgi:Kef-type K+ transport system membrane component KefB
VQEPAVILITLGGLFALGLVTDFVGRRTPLPRVTLLIVLGFAIGPAGLAWLPDPSTRWFPYVADIALVMVGFLLGGGLIESLKSQGRVIWGVALGKLLGAFAVVTLGLIILGIDVRLACLLGALAGATAPAATADVVKERRADGPFTQTLLGVVALDDAAGLVLFSLILAAAQAAGGVGGLSALTAGAWEIGGAVFLGLALGVPMAALTGRLAKGEPTQAEALAGVFLCGGLALALETSFLLASMTMGAVVAARARHHRRPFHAIEGIEWPFMILFFVLAGASLDVSALATLGAVIVAYVVLRTLGIELGTRAGAAASGANPAIRHWMGRALLPQAGIALGMALVAAQRFPELGDDLLNLAVASTALFEIVGPVFTRRAVDRSGDAGRASDP